MSEVKLEKKDFDEIETSLLKKIRNKKKKLEKIIATENKIVSGEIDPNEEQRKMVASKESIEHQIQELNEVRTGMKKEIKNVMTKHRKVVKGLLEGEANQHNTIHSTLKALSDALLINLLQNESEVKEILNEDDKQGLKTVMVPLKNLFTPPSGELNYGRAQECFIEVFMNFLEGSEDLIPGSDTTYHNLLDEVRNIPEEVRTSVHNLTEKEDKTEAKMAELKEALIQLDPDSQGTVEAIFRGEKIDWEKENEKLRKIREENSKAERVEVIRGESSEEEKKGEEEDEKDEGEGEENPNPEYEEIKLEKGEKEEFKIHKKYVDEDGFTHVRDPYKNKFEQRNLKGRGRRGGGKEKKEKQRQRAKVDRGGFSHRGRGRGKHPHDKFGTDEHGKKTKTAHGKHANWHKGEVRVSSNKE